MARPLSPTADPSSDAASILRRLGFGLLLFAMPAAALVARRGVVILAPVAVILLILAASLDGAVKTPGPKLRRLISSPAGVAGILMLFWAILSVIWSPFVPDATERLLNSIVMLLVGILGYLALPERMRSANLYILPVGVTLTALVAIVLSLEGFAIQDPDGQNLERGLIVVVLFLWPAVTWLHSRGRSVEALVLAVVVAIACLFAPDALPLEGLAIGAVIFAIAAIGPSFGARFTAATMAGLLLLAPLLPFLLKPIVMTLMGSNAPAALELRIWRSIIVSEPFRLLTGHGLETALRGRFVGLLPPNAPSTVLFEIWYELGLVGAAAGAMALFAAATLCATRRPGLTPGIMAAFATAFAFGCFGIGLTQAWWFTALIVAVLIFVAVERGQFRTQRPKAMLRKGL